MSKEFGPQSTQLSRSSVHWQRRLRSMGRHCYMEANGRCRSATGHLPFASPTRARRAPSVRFGRLAVSSIGFGRVLTSSPSIPRPCGSNVWTPNGPLLDETQRDERESHLPLGHSRTAHFWTERDRAAPAAASFKIGVQHRSSKIARRTGKSLVEIGRRTRGRWADCGRSHSLRERAEAQFLDWYHHSPSC
jgi:hypothetical protein